MDYFYKYGRHLAAGIGDAGWEISVTWGASENMSCSSDISPWWTFCMYPTNQRYTWSFILVDKMVTLGQDDMLSCSSFFWSYLMSILLQIKAFSSMHSLKWKWLQKVLKSIWNWSKENSCWTFTPGSVVLRVEASQLKLLVWYAFPSCGEIAS